MYNTLDAKKVGLISLLMLGAALLWYSSKSTGVTKVREKAFVVETEPLELPGHTHIPGVDTEYEHSLFSYSAFVATDDLWIEEFESEVVNAPDAILHHGEIRYADRPDQDCPYSPDGTFHTQEPIWFTPNFNLIKQFIYPKPYGVYIEKGTRLFLAGMFHNPDPSQNYSDVFLRLTVRGKKGVRPDAEHRSVRYFRVVSEKCIRGDTFTVPSHTRDFIHKRQKGPFLMPESGTIVLLYPHFHFWDGGKFMAVSLNDEPLWKFYPPKEGSIFFIPDPENPPSLKVKKDDALDFYAVYDNLKNIPNPDVMATVIFLLAPD